MPSSRPAAAPVVALSLAAAITASCSRPGSPAAGAFEPPPMPVETAVARRAEVVDRFTTVGTVEAAETLVVTTEIDGLIADLPLREGESVVRGAVLARLDARSLSAEAERAAALLEQARATRERLAALAEQGIAPQQSVDDATARLRVAEAELSVARTRLEKTVLRAPWDGVLGRRLVSPGTFVRAGDAIAVLADIEEVKVSFSVPERHLASVASGSPVTLSSPAWPGAATEGRVTLVDPIVDPSTRGIRLVARAANEDRRLLPGMSADVSVALARRPGALVVPAEAVFVEGGQSLVYVVGAEGAATRATVEIGSRTPTELEVLSGLAEGDTVVRTGHQKLFPGAKVVPAVAAEGAAGTTP